MVTTMELMGEAPETLTAFPNWDVWTHDASGVWLMRHATGLVCKRVPMYSGKAFRLSVRTPCCGAGFTLGSNEQVRCMACQHVYPYDPHKLVPETGVNDAALREHWWELYCEPLQSVLLSVETGEVAQALELSLTVK